MDPASLDLGAHQRFVLARILERGRLVDVRWVLRQYGEAAVLDFMRHSGHAELSPRTRAFWRAYFSAKDETWESPPSWRMSSAAPWPG